MRVIVVDLRPFTLDIPKDGVPTEDDVLVTAVAQVVAKVVEPMAAALNVVDFKDATRLIAETAIRAVLKERRSNDLEATSGELDAAFADTVARAVESWGIVVSSATLTVTTRA